MSTLCVTVWNENRHEQDPTHVCSQIYPEGIHGAIANHLAAQEGIQTRTATLDEPEHGLSEAVLAETDVLTWWGHMAHEEVAEEVVERVQRRVLDGMGLVVLHSAHLSRVFRRLMGTSGVLRWREDGRARAALGDRARPPHRQRQSANTSNYRRRKCMASALTSRSRRRRSSSAISRGGEVFRSGCTWQRGRGRVFYFRPGHETFPIYRDEKVLRVITNAVRWAAPVNPGRDEVRQMPMGEW